MQAWGISRCFLLYDAKLEAKGVGVENVHLNVTFIQNYTHKKKKLTVWLELG